MSGVSDEDALQALLSSAQQRESERTSGGRNNNNKRPRSDQDHRCHQRPRGDDRNNKNHVNDSYYGPAPAGEPPAEPQRRRRDRWGDRHQQKGPARVEEEDDGNKRPSSDDKDGQKDDGEPKPPPKKANFGLSGALAKDAGGGGNVYKGVVLKFREPPEARTPNTQWRFYVFKGKDLTETLHISKQSAYLMGRNQDICDIPLLHPSLSSQHAVLQYRALPLKDDPSRVSCQPYILDLESTNGTFLNGVQIDGARYYQLKKGDVLKFGASTREYVLMTENTTTVS